ncbi:MAG: hypothetical protein WC155_03650 [Candidatus Cloacimonadales bacterium]
MNEISFNNLVLNNVDKFSVNINKNLELANKLYKLITSNKTRDGEWVKNIFNDNKDDMKERGLIIVKEKEEEQYLIVMSGGHKDRDLIYKIIQERQKGNDGGAVFRVKIKEAKEEKDTKEYDPDDYTWIILSTGKNNIESIDIEEVGILVASLLKTKYPLKAKFNDILEEYRRQKM